MWESILEEIGTLLKNERESRGLKISTASDALKIRKVYLEEIEHANLSKIKPDAYTIGYIKNYAEYLDLDLSELISKLKKACESYQLISSNDNFGSKEEVSPSKKVIFLSSTILVILYMLADFFL